MRIKAVILILLIFSSFTFAQKNYKCFLLQPTGRYSIGTTDLFLTDSTRKEPVKRSYKGFRRIYVKVWYPSNESSNCDYSRYFSGYDTETIYKIFKY
jgi:hypothetical protein